MKRLISTLVLIIALGIALVNAQTANSAIQANPERANDVIKKAKQAIFGANIFAGSNGFSFRMSGLTHIQTILIGDDGTATIEKEEDRKNDDEIYIQLPGKARLISTAYNLNDDPSENYIRTESVFNESNSVDRADIYRNGRKIDIDIVLSRVPKALYEQVKSALSNTKEKRQKSSENMIGWTSIFPLILTNPWSDPTNLKWIGKTQYGGRKADVLETTFSNTSSAKFIFDEESSLLSLIILSTVSNTGYKEEKRISFSNYEKTSGVVISKLIKIEKVSITPKQEIAFGGALRKTQERKVKEVQELILNDFKINPNFKNSFFDF